MDRTKNVITPDSNEAAAPGYDHELFAWSPLPTRPPVSESVQRRLHLAVVIDLGAIEWEDTPETTRKPRPTGARGLYPFPDFPRLSHREFGQRVGIYHLLDMTEDLGIRPAVAMDALTVREYPDVADVVRASASEVIAHGLSASRPISSELSEEEERVYMRTTLEVLGDPAPQGWLGPECSATMRTLGLAAEAGLRYLCEWANDDEPYPTTAQREGGDRVWIHPMHTDLSDLSVVFSRKVLPWEYGARVRLAADMLARDSAERPRVLTLHLHPWITGQAHVLGSVRDALRDLVTDLDPVILTPGEAVEAWARA